MSPLPINPLGAAALFTLLGMGLIGAVIVLPIACILWTWNAVVINYAILPPINVWQAVLLYLAMATVLYLSGVVQIEIEQPERLE